MNITVAMVDIGCIIEPMTDPNARIMGKRLHLRIDIRDDQSNDYAWECIEYLDKHWRNHTHAFVAGRPYLVFDRQWIVD